MNIYGSFETPYGECPWILTALESTATEYSTKFYKVLARVLNIVQSADYASRNSISEGMLRKESLWTTDTL